MNAVRSVISVFLMALLLISIAGWNWAGTQPSPKLEGARVVLGLCAAMAVGSLGLLWTTGRPRVT